MGLHESDTVTSHLLLELSSLGKSLLLELLEGGLIQLWQPGRNGLPDLLHYAVHGACHLQLT